MNRVWINFRPISGQGGDVMVQCPLCGGAKRPGSTIHSVDLGDGVVVVRSVPAQVCSQCGEEWIDSQVAHALEEIVEQARKQRHQVEVLAFQ